MIERETQYRLRQRAKEGHETLDDVINYLLDETVVEVELEDVVETLFEEFEYIACIVVHHPLTPAQTNSLTIRVYTSDVDGLDKPVDVYGPEHRIVIETDVESATLDLRVRATCGGPIEVNSPERTTIYMAETVIGAHPLDLDTGVNYLREKLVHPDDWEWDRTGRSVDQISE